MFGIDNKIIQLGLEIKNSEKPVRDLSNQRRWAFDHSHFNKVKDLFGNLSFVQGAVFWHNEPYPIHVDVYDPRNKTNLLIPLHIDEFQEFIIFDQEYDGSMTWKNKADKNIKKSQYSDAPKSTTGLRPCDTDGVVGLTGTHIDNELGSKLPEHDDFYFGLSGRSYEWKPGIGMAFESKRLHATGKMHGDYFKTGMALWFTNTTEEVIQHFKGELQC